MSETARWTGPAPPQRGRPAQQQQSGGRDGANLADILERVLDKGIVIAGDIQVNLLDIELLTIKIRLVVASVDRAKEMGIDWWERDPTLSAGRSELEDENRELRARIEALERGGLPPGEADGGDADDADADDADAFEEDEPEQDEPEQDEPEPVDEEPVDEAPDDRRAAPVRRRPGARRPRDRGRDDRDR